MSNRITIELADTSESDVRGASSTNYLLLPRKWLTEINDAGKKRLFATQFAYQTELQTGQKDVVIPKRRKYFGSGSEWGASVAADGTDVNFTAINNLSGVLISPVDVNKGVTIANQAIRTNALDVVRAAKEELTYAAGDEVDWHVTRQMASDSYRSTSTTLGSQAIYGGDATQASELTAGDVISTDHVAAAKRKLQSTVCKYWTYGTSEGSSSETKNPWINEAGSPFVLMLAPEQEETFITDSQFVNASEYGDASVVKNGEIGKYLGITIVVANNTPYYAASATHADTSTTAVAQHRCMMFKSQKAVGLCWGLKPKLVLYDNPNDLTKRLILEQSYKAEIIHPDAIVHINVADQ